MDKRRHHYVPKFYLKGFTQSENNNAIWVYDKKDNKYFSASLEKIACEIDYYSINLCDSGEKDTNTMENYLSDCIENPATPVINKLREREIINTYDKMILSNYISVMLKRVPKNRERLENIKPGVVKSVSEKIEKIFIQIELESPESKDVVEKHREILWKTINSVNYQLPKEIILQQINTSLAEMIFSMSWIFYYCDENDINFVTSDNPCFFFEGLGLKNNDSELSFPISKNIALWGSWNKDFQMNFIKARRQIVKEFNRRIISNTSRFVYSSTQEHWILDLLNKKNHRLSMIK